jgi:DNA-binding MarR family transcriptional regulator|tara:strand:+ start:124 stop:903 length:780 start_codon:yes stop_codon:yes gene_type:complete
MSSPGKLSDFTVEQRVLIHLFEHPKKRSQWEGKQEQTQAGISGAVGIARKHLPRTLKSLMAQDLVEVETRHVAGSKQRCRIYFLTPVGNSAAEQMREGLSSREISTDQGETTLGQFAGRDIPFLHVLSHLTSENYYDASMHDYEVDEDTPSVELYRKVLHRAWNDGQITADERGMLDDISLHLGLEPDIVDKIESGVSSERVESSEHQTDTFLEVLEVAWQDGFISDDEQAMLDSLARSLGLDSEYIAKVQLEWIIRHS